MERGTHNVWIKEIGLCFPKTARAVSQELRESKNIAEDFVKMPVLIQ